MVCQINDHLTSGFSLVDSTVSRFYLPEGYYDIFLFCNRTLYLGPQKRLDLVRCSRCRTRRGRDLIIPEALLSSPAIKVNIELLQGCSQEICLITRRMLTFNVEFNYCTVRIF